ncbi:MAG: hypothetical protein WCL39_00470 [Armatimonadota bacterium]
MIQRKIILSISSLAVLLLASRASALVWNVEPAHYIGGIPGNDSSLILNGATPQVAFSSEGQVLLATGSSAGYSEELVANCGVFGGGCSLARSGAGAATIAYVDASTVSSYVRFAYKSGSTWITEFVDGAGVTPDYISLAYDSAGTAMIAYASTLTYGGATTIKMARRLAANSWAVESVVVVGDQTGPSLAVDSSGKIHILFVDAATNKVRLATRISAGSWSVEDVDGGIVNPSQPYYYPSLACLGSVPHVAYFTRSGSTVSLMYANKPGLSWVKEPAVALADSYTQYASLAIASDGVPSIAYFDSTAQTLGFARKAGAVWLHETADNGSMTGFRPSLVLDSSGGPMIAYSEAAFGNVNVASTAADTVDTAKAGSDGSLVTLAHIVASTSSADLTDSIYVQNLDRVCGIRVYFGSAPPAGFSRGDVVTVSGGLSTVDGERAVIYPTIQKESVAIVPAPFGMGLKSVGGGPCYYVPGPPSAGQQGMKNGHGVSTIGLLSRVWGRVTSVTSGMIYIDDGSGIEDGSQNIGVRVLCDTQGILPGQFVSVQGPISCFAVGSGVLAPQIRARAGEVTVH